MGEAKPGLHIRTMTQADIPAGMRLKALAGWNQIEQDWERFLALSPGGCFVAENSGEVVGTVVTVTFEGRCGWVAMVLVSPERRRAGIGSAMLRHGIAAMQEKRVTTVKLDATPMGRQVYLKLGFTDEYGVERWQGRGQACAWQGVRTMRAADLDAVIAFDAPVFGVNRAELLRALLRDSYGNCGVYRGPDGGVLGYVMCRPGSDAYQIGPLVARAEPAAETLLAWALDRLDGEPVFFDVPAINRAFLKEAETLGFRLQREFIRMYLGADPCGGDPQYVYMTSGPEKG